MRHTPLSIPTRGIEPRSPARDTIVSEICHGRRRTSSIPPPSDLRRLLQPRHRLPGILPHLLDLPPPRFASGNPPLHLVPTLFPADLVASRPPMASPWRRHHPSLRADEAHPRRPRARPGTPPFVCAVSDLAAVTTRPATRAASLRHGRSTGSSYLEDDPYYTAQCRRLGPPIRSREAPSDYAQGRECTFCGRKTPLQISWSNPNPGRRYDSCQRVKNKCKFFRWYDEEGEVLSPFTKQLIIDLRDVVWDKMEEISCLELELLLQKWKKEGSCMTVILMVLVSVGLAMSLGMITSAR
ncbi:hypothetical protein QYE76_036806 [Lolium multiflorum]|uniref:GRF-type domain-containing protein n=1 Tax=Lolium multiflorum TaxID=4521 RepID=A0AAD8R1P2_LOLMU|nr:hypothetical protein QYE76_036806 [Lolium multiflorum]